MRGRREKLTVVSAALVVACIAAAIAAPPSGVRAAPEVPVKVTPSRSVIIDHAVALAFVPEHAFFLVQVPIRGSFKVPAVLVPPFTEDEGGTSSSEWRIGSKLTLPREATFVGFSAVVRGKNQEYHLVPMRRMNVVSDGDDSGLDALNAKLTQQQELLSSWQVQVKAQEGVLKRMRADADVIANVGRIVDVMEQIETRRYELENAQHDIDALHELLRQAKDQETPKNYARRELELTKQITELAQRVREIEKSEPDRRMSAHGDLQRKLAVVEATRTDDESALTDELRALQEKRARLEQAGMVEKPPTQGNYWELQ